MCDKGDMVRMPQGPSLNPLSGAGAAQQPGGFAAQLFGSSSSAATQALGLKKNLVAHEQNIGIQIGLMTAANRTARAVIDSIGK